MRREPFAEEHLPFLDGLIADPVSLRFTRIPEPTPPGFPRLWLDSYEAGRRDGTREAFAAIDDDGTFLGLALAPEIERSAQEAELGGFGGGCRRGLGLDGRLGLDLGRLGALAGPRLVELDAPLALGRLLERQARAERAA